jgi:hypothetical protein
VVGGARIYDPVGDHGRNHHHGVEGDERLLDIDSPRTRPHLNGASPGVEVEGPRGVAIVVMKVGGGGVTAGATTTAITVGSVVVVPPLLRLSQVVVVGHWRWWQGTARGGAALEKRRSSLGRRHSRGRVGRGWQTSRVWE